MGQYYCPILYNMPDFLSSDKRQSHGCCEFLCLDARKRPLRLTATTQARAKPPSFSRGHAAFQCRTRAFPIPILQGRDMFQLKAILAAPFMLAAFAAAPTMAQYYPGPPPGYVGPEFRVIPEPEIVSILRSLGFTPIERPRLQGRLWIVRALDQDEIPMRVVLDASTGEAVDAIAMVASAPPRAPRYGMLPNDLDEPEYPPPPAARAYPGQPGPRAIYCDRDFHDDELPPPRATVGPRSGLEGPRRSQGP